VRPAESTRVDASAAPAPEADALRADLAPLVGGRASSASADRVAYSKDLWPRNVIAARAGRPAPTPPAVVVWPETTAEVAAVVRYAAARGVPVVPFGAGSGVCGGIAPTPASIVLDVKRMRAITRIDDARLRVTAQTGILGQILEDRLAERGYTLGHFPSSIYCSTLGGWLAARSAGQCSGRYGKIEDMVRGLRFVDGAGVEHALDIDGAGERDGRDLLPLVIGSEGILGVITEATCRIAPAPASRRFASYLFDETEQGLEAIRAIYQGGLRPAVARLYDPFDTLIARRSKEHAKTAGRVEGPPPARALEPGLGAAALTRALRAPGALNALVEALPGRALGGAMLVLVWEDDAAIADAEAAEAAALCEARGGRDAGEGPARRWLLHRHSVSYRQSPVVAMGAFVDTMEVASTWDRLVPMYHAVLRALSPFVFVMAHFSHAYPDGGSIYFTFAGSARDDDEALRKYDAAWAAALRAVVDAGGTLSHHHGVGRSKAPAMRREQGAAVDVVRRLKAVLDPAGILNPGALIGADPPGSSGGTVSGGLPGAGGGVVTDGSAAGGGAAGTGSRGQVASAAAAERRPG
jgi:alkyldihydroxyacetonephosphate synthase